jgi:Zn-finger nucleic acid-binding protein
VHCAACFTLNPADAMHCAGCGEKLGLQPLELPSEHECPGCQAPLRAFGASSGRLSECTRCGGQFVEHALLGELLERRELYRVVTRVQPPRQNPLDRPVAYLKCPVCQTVMNRNNFGGNSGIVVDVCSRHGVWFDPGELPRILEFVQAGGLERARQRAVEERKERERTDRISLAGLRAPESPTVRFDPFSTAELAKDLGELLTELGEMLRERFRR